VSGRFSVLRRIGEGGMGTVYEVFDAERKARVALKTLTRLEAIGVYQLKNEFRALADVQHPNLVRLHELFAEGDTWFFTMDVVDGIRFDDYVRPTALAADGSETRTVDIARVRAALPQLLEAVRAIHAAGKLHRDLKPSNVLVTEDGRVVVLDFGLAVDPELGGVGQTVADYSVSGTPAYMAPEQAAGEPAVVSSDYYALGVMLFEALTGRLPFDGRMHEIIVRKQHSEAPAPSSFVPETPADLDSLCRKLLARRASDRPNAAALLTLIGTPGTVDRTRSSRSSTLISSIPPPMPRLFGRDAELATLRDAYAAARSGDRPVVVLLSGESGIGKSALVESVLDELRAESHCVVLAGRCFERESVPFKGFDAVVDELSRYLRRLTEAEVSALLPRDVFALRRLFPVLGRITPIAEAPEREVADPHELRRKAFAAFGELLARIRDRQPVVLHLDDLQWSDADSTVLLMYLVRQPDAPRLLVIASHRSEPSEQHPCLEPLYDTLPLDPRLSVRQMKLAPLSAEAARELLQHQLPSLPAAITDSAGGNPFLLVELARYAAANTGAPTHELSLRPVLMSRISALPAVERQLLEVLAVAARPIALSLAAAAAGIDDPPRTVFVALRLENLARATGDGTRIECFHDKIREAILHSLSPEALRAHHRALADKLLASGDADPEQLAGHLIGAGDRARAAQQFALAAARASCELGFDRAARLYECAILHGQFDPEAMRQLRVAHADALAYAGRGARAADAYALAYANAPASEAIELQLRAAEQCLKSGALERGLALQSAALRALGVHVPKTTAAATASVLYHDARLRLRNHRWRGRVSSDPEVARRIDALRRAANSTLRLHALRGVEFGLRGALLALEHGDERDAAMALVNIVVASVLLGKDARAVEAALRRAERLAGHSADVDTQAWWLYGRGLARVLGPAYDPEGALADFESCIEVLNEPVLPDSSYNRAWMVWFRASTRVSMGRLAETASEILPRLDDAWNRHDLSLVPIWAGRLSALCGIASGDVTAAEHNLAKARAAWNATEATLQDISLHEGTWLLHVYAGRFRAAWEAARGWHDQLSRSMMSSSRLFVNDADLAVGLSAAALASQATGRERRSLLDEVARIARGKGEADQPLVRAALACQKGERDVAIAALRVLPEPRSWGQLQTYAAQRRLGVLLGGSSGNALLERADAFFRKGGVVDPERFTAALLPGIELRSPRG
jgi:serine/threonine protein kinase